MKIVILIILMGVVVSSTAAQAPDLKVIASAGNSYTIENFQLDWTLGEPVILTLENAPVLLSQGFHQPAYDVVSAVDNPLWVERFNVFPSPCKDELNIHLQLVASEDGLLELHDMNGKCILNETFSDIIIDKHYSLAALPAGQYMVSASVPEQHKIQTITFIKL